MSFLSRANAEKIVKALEAVKHSTYQVQAFVSSNKVRAVIVRAMGDSAFTMEFWANADPSYCAVVLIAAMNESAKVRA